MDFVCSRGFASAEATKGLSDRPLETFGATHVTMLYCCLEGTNSTQTKSVSIQFNKHGSAREGVQRATADFVRFHCPLEAWRCPVWKESHLCNQAIHKRPFAEKRAKKRPALKHGFNIGRICAMKRLGDNYALAISTSLVKATASFTARSARILRLTVMLCFFRPLMNVE